MTYPPCYFRSAAHQGHATAIHEAAHAVAYISLGLRFTHVSVDEAFTAGAGEMMDDWQRAVTRMAGPASEGIMAHWGTGGDCDVIDYVLCARAEALEDADEPLSDNINAGPLAVLALPVSLALVSTNWAVIEDIAQAAMKSPACLDYESVIAIAAGRVRLDPVEYRRWDGFFRDARQGLQSAPPSLDESD
ncbi:hypothetical protein [Arthrobacter cupressi]